METIQALNIAVASVWYELRCYWCEVLFAWAIRMAPEGYVPSFVELIVEERAERRQRQEGTINRT